MNCVTNDGGRLTNNIIMLVCVCMLYIQALGAYIRQHLNGGEMHNSTWFSPCSASLAILVFLIILL